MNKTPISALQELMVARHKGIPVYTIEDAKIGGYSFMCTVVADGTSGTGYGTTKQAAKQNSAKKLLEEFGYHIAYEETNNNNVIQFMGPAKPMANINYVGKLNELASQKAKPYPMYSESTLPVNGVFVVVCNFMSRQASGKGQTKKAAKQEAARNMLDMLKTEDIDEPAILGAKKIENINRLTEQVLKRFDQLSFSSVQMSNSMSNDVSELKGVFNSLDELTEHLERNGHKCIISVFQRNPYIMAMEIEGTSCSIADGNFSRNNHCRVMGVGDTKEKALDELKRMVELMITHKFSFGITNKVKSA